MAITVEQSTSNKSDAGGVDKMKQLRGGAAAPAGAGAGGTGIENTLINKTSNPTTSTRGNAATTTTSNMMGPAELSSNKLKKFKLYIPSVSFIELCSCFFIVGLYGKLLVYFFHEKDGVASSSQWHLFLHNSLAVLVYGCFWRFLQQRWMKWKAYCAKNPETATVLKFLLGGNVDLFSGISRNGRSSTSSRGTIMSQEQEGLEANDSGRISAEMGSSGTTMKGKQMNDEKEISGLLHQQANIPTNTNLKLQHDKKQGFAYDLSYDDTGADSTGTGEDSSPCAGNSPPWDKKTGFFGTKTGGENNRTTEDSSPDLKKRTNSADGSCKDNSSSKITNSTTTNKPVFPLAKPSSDDIKRLVNLSEMTYDTVVDPASEGIRVGWGHALIVCLSYWYRAYFMHCTVERICTTHLFRDNDLIHAFVSPLAGRLVAMVGEQVFMWNAVIPCVCWGPYKRFKYYMLCGLVAFAEQISNIGVIKRHYGFFLLENSTWTIVFTVIFWQIFKKRFFICRLSSAPKEVAIAEEEEEKLMKNHGAFEEDLTSAGDLRKRGSSAAGGISSSTTSSSSKLPKAGAMLQAKKLAENLRTKIVNFRKPRTLRMLVLTRFVALLAVGLFIGYELYFDLPMYYSLWDSTYLKQDYDLQFYPQGLKHSLQCHTMVENTSNEHWRPVMLWQAANYTMVPLAMVLLSSLTYDRKRVFMGLDRRVFFDVSEKAGWISVITSKENAAGNGGYLPRGQ
ncbi:unnamed protein product [Amoebophrya sp. A120]|nr:unnamed protein product [Amoebophrya sp. A120]|eukprot:GSA120T00005828001.1